MNTQVEIPIDHEVRIRLLEEICKNIDKKFEKLESKIDSQFHWMLGTIISLFGITFLSLIGAVVLHNLKLI